MFFFLVDENNKTGVCLKFSVDLLDRIENDRFKMNGNGIVLLKLSSMVKMLAEEQHAER